MTSPGDYRSAGGLYRLQVPGWCDFSEASRNGQAVKRRDSKGRFGKADPGRPAAQQRTALELVPWQFVPGGRKMWKDRVPDWPCQGTTRIRPA